MSVAGRIREALGWRLHKLRTRVLLARARLHRSQLKSGVFVGITGSAGKTTTKDLALAVLARSGPVTANSASLNYLVDLAKVIISAKRSDRFTIVEIAVTAPGSIDAKIALARPLLAVLTVVQRDHIKNFDSVEDIAAEKGKLILTLPPEGTAVLNIDDPLVRRIGEQARARRIWFGCSEEADIRLIEATSVYPDPLTLVIEYLGREYRCVTGLHGTHLAVPVMAAIGLGVAAGMSIEACIDAIPEASTTPGRMEIAPSTAGVTFLRDDYKAPYWSFQATMDYLRSARARRKVAVIGTLSDYSLSASKLYPKVARQAMAEADLVVFVGPHALRALKARRDDDDRALVGFTEIEEANRYLQDELREGDLVLLKGSNRADHLVRLVLARNTPVTCWVSGCGLNRFCNVCPRLSQPVSTPARGSPPGLLERYSTPDASVTQETSQSAGATQASDAWLVVGMGNHGERYAGTPHNIGFEVVDWCAREWHLDWGVESEGLLCRGRIGEQEVMLFKAATPINLCGSAVERVRNRFGVRSDQVIVVHDDTDLLLANSRVKLRGSDGGHKGLRSVFSALGNDGFMPRIRVGVRPPHVTEVDAKSLVLQRFAADDAAAVEAGVAKAVTLLQGWITSHAWEGHES